MERRTRAGILLAVAALCLTGTVAFILGGRVEHHRTSCPVMGTVAGMTLYTVGSVKSITGYKNYVSIDGGMPDNPRYALYESPYTVYNASRASAPMDFPCSVVGRCCESGDIIQEGVTLPKPVRGEIIAVAVTGAYNYSMASNYNRIPRPAVVMLKGGEDRLAVHRESNEDMIRNEV